MANLLESGGLVLQFIHEGQQFLSQELSFRDQGRTPRRILGNRSYQLKCSFVEASALVNLLFNGHNRPLPHRPSATKSPVKALFTSD